jgi:sensor histidine kinase YesM
MQKKSSDPKNFLLGMIFIFSGILVFFGFFFSIFLFSDGIFESPFIFILLFFAMFFIMALVIIAGTFFIQKSTKQESQRMNESLKLENSLKSSNDYNNKTKNIKNEKLDLEKNFCQKCGSSIYYNDKFCLNCGTKV